jgi:hypothetical protein
VETGIQFGGQGRQGDKGFKDQGTGDRTDFFFQPLAVSAPSRAQASRRFKTGNPRKNPSIRFQ